LNLEILAGNAIAENRASKGRRMNFQNGSWGSFKHQSLGGKNNFFKIPIGDIVDANNLDLASVVNVTAKNLSGLIN
jgi:hypothetical protein